MKHLLTKLLRKFDGLVCRLAYPSIVRLIDGNPGIAYVFELNLRDYVDSRNLSPELRRATELFHESYKSHKPL